MKKNLKKEHPDICKEWDYELNKGKMPEEYAPKSSAQVYWKCPNCSMSYPARISDRTAKGSGCPYCAGKKPIPGVNDLLSQRPDLANEWSPNNTLKLDEVTIGSNRTVLWVCPIHGEYPAHIVNRVKRGDGCKKCGFVKRAKTKNEKKLSQTGSFQDKYPEIAKEWHPTKNKNKNPSDYLPSSHEHIWWKCSICGNEWRSTINARTSNHSGCKKCHERAITSFPEQAIFYYVKKCFQDAINRYKEGFGQSELDIYIPSKKTGIEYDGSYWHKHRDSDKTKYDLCKRMGIFLIRVIEENQELIDETADKVILRESMDNEGLQKVIKGILSQLSTVCDIDVNRDETVIKERFIKSLRSQSLVMMYPEIAKEWHPTKNGTLRPDSFLPGSNDDIWWICSKCGHQWKAPIYNRTHNNQGCPQCWEKRRSEAVKKARLKVGINDLLTKCPHLASEWDFDKNGTQHMQDFAWRSHSEVWWICPMCHNSYSMSIKNRTLQGSGCRSCSAKIRSQHAAETRRRKKGNEVKE